MATKQPDSVVARLMCLDDHPPDLQAVRKQGRVLSDTYIRKAASVGLRNGSSLSARRSFHDNTLHGPGNNKHVLLEKRTTGKVRSRDGSLLKSLGGGNYEERKVLEEKDKYRVLGRVLRYLQKIQSDPLAEHLDDKNKFLRVHPEVVDKQRLFLNGSSVCEPKSMKLANSYDNFKFDLRPESGKFHHQLAYKKLGVSSVVSPRHHTNAHEQSSNQISQQERCRSNYDGVCLSGYMSENYIVNEPRAYMPSFPAPRDYKIYNHSHFSKKSSFSREARKHDIDRWKILKAVNEPKFSGRSQTLDEMLILASGKLVPRNLKLGEHGCNMRQDKSRWRDVSKKRNTAQKNILESLYWRGYKQFQFTPCVNGTIQSSGVSESSETNKAEAEACVIGIQEEMDDTCVKFEPSQMISGFSINDPPQNAFYNALANAPVFKIGVHQSESNLVSLTKEDGHFSYLQGVFSKEASLHESCEEESPYSNCSRIGSSEFQDYSKGTYHCSPDSVLEPVDGPSPSPSECFKNMDLLLQLRDLNFEFDETYSEGSVMAVSGENDSEEGPGDLFPNDRKVQGWLGYHESRNFSYLVDILNEAGFCTKKSFTDIKTWDSLEYPINPRLFDSLEKKYAKQTSWEKSERLLLFDRINSSLMDIVSAIVNCNDCSMSMRKRFNTAWRRDEVEDKLWMMLMREEEEKGRGLDEMVLGRGMKWLELEKDISLICRELETSLFDEVVMELASLWD